jgi:hypothetical protein
MTIPVGYAQCNLMFTGTSVPHGAEVTFGLDISGGGGTPTLDAQAVESALSTAGLMANLANNVSITTIRVKWGPDNTGPSWDEAAALNGSGGSSVGPNTAFLVHKATAFGGHAGRGRMYLPGVPEASVDSPGTLAAGVASAINSDLTTFFNALTTAGIPMVLLHGDSSPLVTPTPVTGIQVATTVATQRRRLRP